MITMKKYKLSILILGLMLIFSSCDDYLDVEYPSAFDETYVFSNTSDAKKHLLGSYAMFAQDSYTSRMSAVWMQNTDVEAIAPGANPDGSRRDIWSLQGGLLANFGDMTKAWQESYKAIDRANQTIEGIQKSGIANDPDMKMMLGEAYCMRAYRYFLVINFWGDVPYFREAAKAGMELDVPKTDKNYIYSGLIQDLVDCEADMYFAGDFGDGVERMNREFALGMIARMALFRAGYGTTKDGSMKRADQYLDVANDEGLAVTYTYNGAQKTARTSSEYYQLAKDYCEKLISLRDRALNPNFAAVFRNQCEWKVVNDSDILYEVAFGSTNGGGDVGWCVGVAVTGGSKGTTTIQVNFTPSYYFSFDTKDLRRDATISKISYTSDDEQKTQGITAMTAGKWNRLWLQGDPGKDSSKGTGINWPIMRYSDVLLMLAEAENELNGPSPLAKQMLTKVRQRAFASADHTEKVTNYINKLNSKEDFFNAIVDERAWEFGGEGLRKFDLGRWNNYGKKIVEAKKFLDYAGMAAFEQNLDNPEVAKYKNLADYLYLKKHNGTITFLNDYYKLDPSQIPEIIGSEDNAKADETVYLRVSWTRSLYKEVKTEGVVTYESADYTTRCWRGYKDESGVAPVPFLLPIPAITVANSQHLDNDGYGLVTN